MDSFSFYLRELDAFNHEIYQKSIVAGNIAYILASKARISESIWIREAGYLCDIGTKQVGPIYISVQNKKLLEDANISAKLENTRRFHVRRSMNLIDSMDDIDKGLREYYKDLVDLHHCLYDSSYSYCGHNLGFSKDSYIPCKDEIPKDAQILSASVSLSAAMSMRSYDISMLGGIIENLHHNRFISNQQKILIKECELKIKKCFIDKTIFNPVVTSPQQKQAMVSFGGGIFSKEHGAYRYSSSRKLHL